MGNGCYALDFDGYKEGCVAQQWLTQWQVPQTRTHLTVSGGWHLIYRTSPEWFGLGSRQHVVSGLDTRGKGGWIAFGEGYSVTLDVSPARLPDAVCFELSKAPARADAKIMPVMAVEAAQTWHKLRQALFYGRPSLRHRWAGGTDGAARYVTQRYGYVHGQAAGQCGVLIR